MKLLTGSNQKKIMDGNDGGLGAWEIGLRHTNNDLNGETIREGVQIDITLGINW